MAASCYASVGRLPWSCAQAGPLGTLQRSPVTGPAATLSLLGAFTLSLSLSRLDHALVGCGLFPAVRTCKVGTHRQESDHFPLELQQLLTAPAHPVSPPPPQASTPTWVWDGGQRGPYAGALMSEPCQTLIADCTACPPARRNTTWHCSS